MAELLPWVAGQELVDHHCHGVLARDADQATLESMLNEGTGWRGGSQFDSQAGFAFRRWCPPVLGHPLEPDDLVRGRARQPAELRRGGDRFRGEAGVHAHRGHPGPHQEPLAHLGRAELGPAGDVVG